MAQGETLESIAKNYNVPVGLLAKINGVTNQNQLRVGDEIKVVPGPFSAEINLSKKRMTLLLNGCYAGSFDILSLGSETAEYRTQSYAVMHKTDNVIYRSSNNPAGSVPAGDGKNPLGNYLWALSEDLVVHGVGSEVAPTDQRGSVRLSARDIEDVYDILKVGSVVVVKR